MSETILQFGPCNFLRAFADLIVAQANARGNGPGRCHSGRRYPARFGKPPSLLSAALGLA
jgi:hypothetical protein